MSDEHTVPAHPAVDVVIPAHDAEETLPAVLDALPRRAVRNVLVVDQASTDRTSRVAEQAGAVVTYEPRGGLGAACLRGIAHLAALPVPPDVVVFLEPDRPDPARALPGLLAPIAEGRADLVLGTRAAGPGGRKERPLRGAVATALATSLIGALYGHRYSDLGACRAIRFPALVALNLTDRDHGFMVEMQIKALKIGLRVAEVAVAGGDAGPMRRGGSVGAGTKILYTILRHSMAR